MQQEKKIKVLEAIRQGQVGGGETHILNLVEHIDKSRFEPVVLAFTDGQMIDTLNKNGTKNFVIPSNKPFDVFVWKKVKKLLQDEKIDIVHVHGTRANSNVYWAAKSLKLPILYTIHGWSFHDDQSWFVKHSRIWIEQWITKNATYNISVSSSNQKTGIKHIPHFSSVVINNGINLDAFNPALSFKNIRKELGIADNKIIVGFLARMTLQKDPLTLIEAFKKVTEKKDDIILLMVGDGELKEKAIARANELGINDKIVFEKFRTDVPDILNAMDIFCLPSLWEGLPIGLLEAMAMSKAVVATAADGSKEILSDNKNGIIVPAQDTAKLAEAILKFANEKTLCKKFGNAARQTVMEHFDIRKMTKEIENLYLNTMHLN